MRRDPVMILRFALALTAAALLALPAAARADMPLPPSVSITVGACPDTELVSGFEGGCAYPDGRVFVSSATNQFVLWHEVGHVFAYMRLTPGDHNWFMRAFHLHGAWRDGDVVDDDGQPGSEPAEVFADEYAACQLGLRPGTDDWASGHTFDVQPRQHQRICRAIGRVGRRAS